MARQVTELLVRGPGLYVDGTLGGGGHARILLERMHDAGYGGQSFLIGIDQDPCALDAAEKKLGSLTEKAMLVRGNFGDIGSLVKSARKGDLLQMPVVGILLDLGVSSFQIDSPERGFSYLKDGPLDMRMSADTGISAADIVNGYQEGELARLFLQYGEEPLGKRIARAIVAARSTQGRIATTGELSAIVRRVQLRNDLVIKTLARIFQALRIAVNDELGVLRKVLEDGLALLAKGGRMAVISYHSLEDRIVKRFFAQKAQDDWGPKGLALRTPLHSAAAFLVTKKPVLAFDEEIRLNPRARSARLRVIEKR
jgi:16S rRNA (cytosine1402-N4)-methyltransferase